MLDLVAGIAIQKGPMPANPPSVRRAMEDPSFAPPKCCLCGNTQFGVVPLRKHEDDAKLLARTCSWTDPLAPQLDEKHVCSSCVEKVHADPAADRYVQQARATGMELPE